MTSAQGTLDSMALNFDNRNDHASAIVCFRLDGSNELFPPTADTPPVVLVQPKLSTLDYFPVLPLRGPLNGNTRLLLSDEAMRKDLSSTSTRQVMFILTNQANSTVNCDLSDARLVGISPVQMSDSAISAVYLPNVTINSGILRICISVSSSKGAIFVPADARVVVSSAGLDEKSYVLRLWFKDTYLPTTTTTSSDNSSPSTATAVMECKESVSYVTSIVANELLSLDSSSGVEVSEVSKIGNAIFTIAVGVTGSTSNAASNAAVAQLYTTIRNKVSLLENTHTCNGFSFAPSVVGVAFPNGSYPSSMAPAAIVAATTTPPTSEPVVLMAPAGHASFAIFAVLALPLTLGVVLYAMCCGKVQEVLPGISEGDVEMGEVSPTNKSKRAAPTPSSARTELREEDGGSPIRRDGALTPVDGVSGAASPMPTHPLEKYMSASKAAEGGGGDMTPPAAVSPTSRTAENFHLDDRPVLSPRAQLKPEDYQDPLDS